MERGSAKPPYFDGTNYPYWKIRMCTYLQSIGSCIWEICENVHYEVLAARVGQEQVYQHEANCKARNALFLCLSPTEFDRVSHRAMAQEIWKNIMRELLMLRPDSLRLTGVSMRTLFSCLVSRSIRYFLGFR